MASEPTVAQILRPALVAMGAHDGARMMQRDAEEDGDEAGAFAFAPGLVADRLADALARRATREQALAFVVWTERSDVAPFLELERQTVAPEMDGRVDAFFDASPDLDLDTYGLVQEMLVCTDALARGADLAIHALAAAIMADEADLPLDEQTELGDLIPEMLGTRESLAESMHGEMEDVYMVLYSSKSKASIRAFLDALMDPAAQWYYATIGRAWSETLVRSFRDAAALGSGG